MLYNTIIRLLEKRNFKVIKEIFLNMNEADIADLFGNFHDNNDVDKKDFPILYRLLPKDAAADVFAYMDSDMQMMLINSFTDKELEEVIDDLFIDDTVDLIEEMPANVVSRILKAADSDTRKQINQILKYPKDSAGSIMTTEYVYLNKDMTVKDALLKIRQLGMVKETVYTLYVTESRRLIGVLSVLDILTADDDDSIESIMDSNVITVDTLEDKELVAAKFSKYDFLALPVVDKEFRIVGIVTFDDAMDVIQDEMNEDYARLAGLTAEEDLSETLPQSMKKRLPWLMVLLALGMIVSSVVGIFETVVSQLTLIMAFQSLILDMAGNVGTQSLAVTIRVLMDESLTSRQKGGLVLKEMKVGLCNGLVLGILSFVFIGLYILIFKGKTLLFSYAVSGCIGVSLMLAMIVSSAVGTVIPIFFKKIKIDPAVASGPLITTINDLVAVVTYYGMSWLLLLNVLKLA